MKTLLGHLSQFSTLQSQGEVLCTQGLGFLLQNPETSEAFAQAIGQRAGRSLPAIDKWKAEAYQIEDSGRPDLEACAPDGSPVIKVEAKLGAELGGAQLHSYATDLERRSGGGILVVLVPVHRMREAAATIAEAFGTTGEAPWCPECHPGITVITISWEDLFKDLASSDSSQDPVTGLQELYEAITCYTLKPLAGQEDLLRWKERKKDFIELVDRVARLLQQDHGCWMGPFGPDFRPSSGVPPERSYHRKYLCLPVEGDQPFFSIGVRNPFEGWTTPIWLRFNRTTPLFSVIRYRLVTSDISERVISSRGHAWLPLEVPLESDEETMVSSLIQQALAVIEIAIV